MTLILPVSRRVDAYIRNAIRLKWTDAKIRRVLGVSLDTIQRMRAVSIPATKRPNDR